MNPSRSPLARRVLDWLPEILFVGVTTAVGIWAGGRWLDPSGDPGFSWSLAYRLAEGDVLYRDVYLAYTPLTPYLLAALGRMFDFSAGFVVGSSWSTAIVAGLLLLRCARPFLSSVERIAVAALILACSLWVPGPGRLVFPYYPGVAQALALALGAMLVVRNPRLSIRTQCGFAGLLCGLSFLAKQEIGVAALIALLVSFLLRPRELLRRGLPLTAAFAAVALTALGIILLAPGVTLDSLRNNNHLWPLDLVPPGDLNRLFRVAGGTFAVGWAYEVRQTAWSFLLQVGLLASAGLLAARARRLSDWLPVFGLASLLLAWWAVESFRFSARAPVELSCAISFAVAALAVGARQLEGREHIVAIGTFAGLAGLRAIFSRSLSGPFDGPAHLGASLTWVIFLCVLVPRVLVPGARGSAYLRRMMTTFLLISGGYGAARGAENLRFPWRVPVPTMRGTVFLDPSRARFLRSLSREIRPGDKVLVLPEINAVDVLFAGRSVSPLEDHLPGWLDLRVEDDLLRRFRAVPPETVVLFNRPLQEFGYSRFGERYGERIAKWIEENYRPVLSERVGSVLRPRSGPAIRQ
jgi:hypothetical protein